MTNSLLLFLALALVRAQKPTPLAILPLGDSITYGCGDNCSSVCTAALPCSDCLRNRSGYTPCAPCSSGYRLALWRTLSDAGRYAPEMVGPLSQGPAGAPAGALSHAGWPGIRISGESSANHTTGLVQVAAQWAPFAARAHAVLLHIGTNDVLQNGYTSADAAARDMGGQLAALLAAIRAAAPKARVYVASVISLAPTPAFRALNAQLVAFNAAIPFIVEGFVAGGGNAVFVDMARSSPTCSTEDSCCPGGIHPTVLGYEAIASVWAEALVALQ